MGIDSYSLCLGEVPDFKNWPKVPVCKDLQGFVKKVYYFLFCCDIIEEQDITELC